MRNAFLPKQVHYTGSKELKEAIEIANSNLYESIYFDPKNMDNDKVFVLYETNADFRILSTEYDSCLDRFHPKNTDTLHVFPDRKTAFRYLEKVSRV